MPREVRPGLQTLIDSGHCNWNTTVDIILTGGQQMFLSTGEIYVNNFGKTQQYLGKLKDPESLSMSQDSEVDMMGFKVGNVDMVMGRTLTGAVRKMDGAQGTVGTIFIDRLAGNFNLGLHYWDPKMRGELVSGEVVDEHVEFNLVSIIDVLVVSGRTIASEFQWSEPISRAPLFDPSDIPTLPTLGTGGSAGNPYDLPGRLGGRYGEMEGPIIVI